MSDNDSPNPANPKPKADPTIAPTNQGTVDKQQENAKIFTELEMDFITLVQMHYGKTGTVMTPAVGDEDYAISPDEFELCTRNPKVLAVLEDVGISFRRVVLDPNATDEGTSNWRTKGLTALQLMVANTMLDLRDTRSDRKKLQDLSVNSRTYANWLKDPVFSGYLQDVSERMLGDNQHEASLALLDRVRAGDIKAIQYYFDYTGRYRPQGNTPVGINGGQFDAVQLINSLVEIIVDEVSNPEDAQRVAARLKSLMAQRQIVNGLTGTAPPVGNEPIEVPEIAPNRVMTPKLMAAMERGVGVDT